MRSRAGSKMRSRNVIIGQHGPEEDGAAGGFRDK